MSKYNTDWTEEKYKRFIKERRGQGEGPDYKPWWVVQDFPTYGIATRIFSAKTKRMHHFFSNIQLKYFYLLEMEDKVLDIKEHYPLLDLELIISGHFDLRLDKFKDKKSGVPYIITTTFLVKIIDATGKIKDVARSVKAAAELEKKITIERLEIERRYWANRGIDWGIITNKSINTVRVKNIEWLHSMLSSDFYTQFSKEELKEFSEALQYRLLQSQQPARKVIANLEKDYGLDVGTGLLLFKYLIINKSIKVDLNNPINLNAPGSSMNYD